MSLSYFAVTVLLSLLGQRTDPDLYCDVPANARLCDVARDAATAVESATRLPFDGPAANEASTVLLLSIAWHESIQFRADVQTCGLKGDHGRSITNYQLHVGPARGVHSEAELCDPDAGNLLASRLALRWLARYARRGSLTGIVRGYAGGEGIGSREIDATVRTQLLRAGVVQCPRGGELRVVMRGDACDPL